LSGGEKSRLRLCSLTFEGVNFMILDEPTNHLDIDSREVLEETLTEFEGTILMVSHDRYFINKIADKIVEIKDSDTKIYEGDYMYYLEECRKLQNKAEEIKQNIGKHENKSILDKNEITSTNTKNRVNHSTKKSADMSEYQLKRQSDIENEIDHMEKLLKEMDKQMELHSTEPSKLGELFHQKEEIEKKLESTYELWESISVQIIN
jgi:ATPase subunit of ABC transporter with duplicated ATPase domains